MTSRWIFLLVLAILLSIIGTTVWFAFNKSTPDQLCGGITGTSCPAGYTCKYDGNYPDAGGVCVSVLQPIKDKIDAYKYTCPAGEWVDCMPGPGPANPQCQKDYLDWAAKNCPGFRGAAL